METLQGQYTMVKYHSMQEFKNRVNQGKLKKKSQIALLFLKDTEKFRYYVNLFQLDPEVERRLIKLGRKDLCHIYFSIHSCHPSVIATLVVYPKVLSIYAMYNELSNNSQMRMVRCKKAQSTLKYAPKRELCVEAKSFFRNHAQKSAVSVYDRICG